MYAIQEISTGKWVSTLNPLVLLTYNPAAEQDLLEGTEAQMEAARQGMANSSAYAVGASPRPH